MKSVLTILAIILFQAHSYAESHIESFEGHFSSDYLDEVEVAHPMARRSLLKSVNRSCKPGWELVGDIDYEVTNERACTQRICTRYNRSYHCVGTWRCKEYREYFKMTAYGEFRCEKRSVSSGPHRGRCIPSREIRCPGQR